MPIEESKIIDLIASYEKYEEECLDAGNPVNISRAGLYRTMIKDLESLLPRKTLADLDVHHFSELTGSVVEYIGRKGVLLGGRGNEVILFTFTDTCIVYTEPARVYPLDEERIWDEAGIIL